MINNEEEKDDNAKIYERLKLMDEISEVEKRQDWVYTAAKVLNLIGPTLKDDPQVAHMQEIIEDENKRIRSKINDIKEKCEKL